MSDKTLPADTAPELQALLDGIPAVAAYRLEIDKDSSGIRILGELPSEAGVYQGLPHAHGGAVASILDTAATFALLGVTGVRWVTVALRVDYLRPAELGPITCVARVVAQRKQLGWVRAELSTPNGGLSAVADATMFRTTTEVNR